MILFKFVLNLGDRIGKLNLSDCNSIHQNGGLEICLEVILGISVTPFPRKQTKKYEGVDQSMIKYFLSNEIVSRNPLYYNTFNLKVKTISCMPWENRSFLFVGRSSSNTVVISKWNEMVKMFIDDKTLRTMPLCRFLQETDCPECYLENAEHLEKFDPHGLYPTSIYGRCEGDVLAKSDASLVTCTSKYTLTTTAKIVYEVLSPSNPELRNVYQSIGRFVA